jgi:alkyl hydroperoxide reductase subunit AhpC
MEINQPAPVIRVPALMDGTLTYLSTADLHTGCVALCFLPRFGDQQWLMLERRAAGFQAQDSALVGVISEDLILSGPWHRKVWPCGLTLVCDPLGRLARSYGLIGRHAVTRCHSFVIDPQGILRYHLVHDLTDSGFRALLEMVSFEPDTGIQGVTSRQAAYGVQKSVGRF